MAFLTQSELPASSIHQCSNLRRKNGGVPNAAVYACYATRDGKKAKSLATAYQKAKDPNGLRTPSGGSRVEAYTVSDMLGYETSCAQNGDGTAPTFAVPLTLRGDSSNEASLVLALFDYMSDKERREFHAQVESDWKAKQRKDRETELLNLDRELRS
ncbi:hypothetical protein FA13DRAFT_1717148 [Coprinellus micaceus]|uniref:Uncharacterized protein n=1 Tax=Coprinellus micaceus TaxID=71717 RepID=A0A4Y7SHD6_COPMI|nr:hypothetical protein FA13DRAFT_1717148 [Coprinellus micaceus]